MRERAVDARHAGETMQPAPERPPESAAAHGPQTMMVALSGGVDSAVSLLRLKRAGIPVRAMFMKNWEEDDDESCAAADDLADARRICDRLEVELATVNCSAEYWDRVFTRFLDEHRAGRTPNPDVLCNREVKFSAFVEHAHRLGASRIATGHYARLAESDGRMVLRKAADPDKDQTYFLHALDQDQLRTAAFPLGDLAKHEVRDTAREAGLEVHDKKDSTGICFIGERRFRDFLQRFIPERSGPIESLDGETLGEHPGLAFFTIGQRQGLGIGGRRGAGEAPWYVARKDPERNALVVVQGARHRALFATGLDASDASWISGGAPELPLRCTARIRHRQAEQRCTLAPGPEGTSLRVKFDEPQRAVAPGQFVVFYHGEDCLGGAVIDRAWTE